MKKLTIVLAVLAVVFLALAIVSASYSVSRTEAAIDAIGKVAFDDDTREKLDLAVTYLNALDPGLRLEERVSNAETLEAAKLEYVRLAIKTAVVKDQRKTAEGYTDAEVIEAVSAAREALDTYCAAGACADVENYNDLLALEEKYAETGDSGAAEENDASGGSEEAAEEIELC